MDIDGTLRWVLWLIFVAFALFLYFSGPGQSGVGSGHLSLAIEVTLFALGTAAATLRAAKLYPEHDVRGGARPPRPTSLPFSWWHDFTGITVAIDQSHDLSRRLGDSTDNLHTRCTLWTWLTPTRHARLTPHTHNTPWVDPVLSWCACNQAGQRYSRGRQIRACPAMSVGCFSRRCVPSAQCREDRPLVRRRLDDDGAGHA